ncbi:hypothetical protein [Nonomuraea sp. NPDC050643]|uniref:hypothetical protein n=1 Tax=Nonomuraea sp. NPDC050643 TaxID=3155660 RepID=UPI00340AD5F1
MAETTAGAAVIDACTVGAGIDAVAATTPGVAVDPVRVVGAGMLATAATTDGEAVVTAVTVGPGIDAVAATTDGVGFASELPPAGTISRAAHAQSVVVAPGPLTLKLTAVPDEVVLAALRTAAPPHVVAPLLAVHGDASSVDVGAARPDSSAEKKPRLSATLEV